MMKCPYCQTDLADDAKFCYNCGKQVKQDEIAKNNELEEEEYKKLKDKYVDAYWDNASGLVVCLSLGLLLGGIAAGCMGGKFAWLYLIVSILGLVFLLKRENKWDKQKDCKKAAESMAKAVMVFAGLIMLIITFGIKSCFFSNDTPSDDKKDNTAITEVKKEDTTTKKAEEKPAQQNNTVSKQATKQNNVAPKKASSQSSQWVRLIGRMYPGVWVYEGDPKTNDLERFGQITQIDTANGRVQFYRPVSKTYQWFERDNLRQYGGLYIKADDPAYLKAMGKN